jgi:hypothetical protein
MGHIRTRNSATEEESVTEDTTDGESLLLLDVLETRCGSGSTDLNAGGSRGGNLLLSRSLF